MLIIFLYGIIFAAVAVFALLFYMRSVESRKSYVCPQCGEKLRVELMNASHCNMCGAPLRSGASAEGGN